MSSTRTRPAPGRRRSPGWVPNQHGAWAMLVSPLLVGAIAGGFAWVQLPLAAFWLVGYLAFFATALWLKSGRRPRWFPPVRAYGAAAAVLAAVVALARPDLLIWAPAFAVPLAAGLHASARRHDRDLLSGLTMVAGSSLMTVVAYDAGSDGPLDLVWLLAAVQCAYFAGTVFYVKSAIRRRADRPFLAVSVAYHVLVAVAVAWLSPWLSVVFAALAVRAAVVPPRRPSPKTLGIGEIVSTVVVGVVSLLVTQA